MAPLLQFSNALCSTLKSLCCHLLLDQEKASSADLKIEVLTFLQLAMANNPPETFQPYLLDLSEAVFMAVRERYYKVTAKALRVCEEMVRTLRPEPGCEIPSELQPLVQGLFNCTMARLGAQDQDQEVKECAIRCIATEVSVLGDTMPAKVSGDRIPYKIGFYVLPKSC